MSARREFWLDLSERAAKTGAQAAAGVLGPEQPTADGGRSQLFERRTALWHPSAVSTVEAQQ